MGKWGIEHKHWLNHAPQSNSPHFSRRKTGKQRGINSNKKTPKVIAPYEAFPQEIHSSFQQLLDPQTAMIQNKYSPSCVCQNGLAG